MTAHSTPEKHARSRQRILVAGVAAVLLAAHVLHGIHRVNQQRDLDPMDTTAYLQEAHFITEHGGPLGMVRLLLTGTYGYDNRQPLYPWLLSWFASRELAFLPRAKLASLAAGLAAVAVTLWLTRATADATTALIVGLLLLFDYTFYRLTTMVACESLLMVFVMGWWGGTCAAFRRPRWWPLAGVMAGLAFLAKGSGLFLVGATILTVLVRRRWRLLRSGWQGHLPYQRPREVLKPSRVGRPAGVQSRVPRWGWFGLFFAGFVLVTWPLLVRNVRRFRNPLHNVNSATMWLDDWNETYTPAFKTHPPGPLDYLRTHSASEIGDRAVKGVVGQARMTFEALHVLHLPLLFDPDAPQQPVGAPYWLSGLLLLALAATGLAGDRDRDRRALTAVTVALFFVFFSWYHGVVQGPRFMLPMVPLILFYAGRGVLRLWRRLVGASARPLAVGGVALLGLAVVYFAAMPFRHPLTSYDLPPGYADLRDWIRANVARDEPFVLGPTHRYHFQAYTRDFPRHQEFLPAVASLEGLNAWLRERGVGTVVIDAESYVRRQALLGAFITLDREAGLRLVGTIPGWTLVARGPGPPTYYLIFRVTPLPSGTPIGDTIPHGVPGKRHRRHRGHHSAWCPRKRHLPSGTPFRMVSPEEGKRGSA